MSTDRQAADPGRTARAALASDSIDSSIPSVRSTQMFALHEALAREHISRREAEARRNSLARELASARRWRYLELRAHEAYRRHAQRANRAAEVLAVAK